MSIDTTIVGNPGVYAGMAIEVHGTGNPLIDRVWSPETVKHIFDGSTYKSSLDLRIALKHGGNKMLLNFDFGDRRSLSPETRSGRVHLEGWTIAEAESAIKK